jgi:uncharacterized membrane protein YcjF (UPF0283 family)
MTGEGAAAAADQALDEIAVASEQQVKVRRTPRYGRFMILGAAVFAAAALIVTYSFPQGQGYNRNEVFGFVVVTAIAVGVAVGALAALIANLVTRRTERTLTADRIDVRVVEAGEDADGASADPDPAAPPR